MALDLFTHIQSLAARYLLEIPLVAASVVLTYMKFFGGSDQPVETFFCPRPILLPRDKLASPPDSQDEYFSDLVRRRLSSVFGASAGFKGVWWLPGAHAHTIYTSIGDFSQQDLVEYARTYIHVADGGTLALDMTPSLDSAPREEGEPVLVVAHGLTGGSHEAYVRATLNNLTARTSAGGLGMRAVVLNSRGCNQSPVTTPKLYNAGTTDDMRAAVLWIAKNFPGSPIFGIGFSLGANAMTKYVGEEGEACPLAAAVVLANPWDFIRGAEYLASGTLMNKYIYRYVMGGAIRALVSRHRNAFLDCPNPPLPADVVHNLINKRFVSLRYFDDTVTAPVFGFANSQDYYASVSSSRFVSKVRIPLLGLNSADDPVIGTEPLPQAEILMNPWVFVVRTAHGGHLGWFEKGPDGALRRWYVRPVREFFEALIDYKMVARPRVPFKEEDGKVTSTDRPDISYYEISADGLPRGMSVDESTSAVPFASRVVRKLFSGW